MEIFNEDIIWLRKYIEEKKGQGRNVRVMDFRNEGKPVPDFFESKGATIVLSEDTWLELGKPGTFSTAPALVTGNCELVNDGTVTLIGPDINEATGSIPFAQILLIASGDLKDEDYRKINTFQYELELKGYMIKAVPSSLTIWSRVSRESARAGLSFEILGKAIIESYKSKFNDSSVEMIFITSSKEDVEALKDLHKKVMRIISAMNKMMAEMSFDCSSCEYLDVCGDVRQLGALREKLMKQRQGADG